MRVVGTLTTTPSRINHIKDTLLSIYHQSHKLDAVYLNIPYRSVREDCQYIVPDGYNDFCNIIRCRDYGPITKILGALLEETAPDTIIITFDDDKIYPEGLVEKLISKHKQKPNAAIGSAGYKLGSFPFYMSIAQNEYKRKSSWYSISSPQSGEQVDVLVGYPGVLYVRNFFPNKNNLDELLRYASDHDALFYNDDLVFSGYLELQDIPRILYKLPQVREADSNENGLSDSRLAFVWRFLKALYAAKKEGMFTERVDYQKSKTVTYPVVLIAMAIIVGVVLWSTKKKREKE